MSVDDLASAILSREIEWQRLNQRLYIGAVVPSFKRGRRNWLWAIGNALPTEGGLIAATALFYSHSNDRRVISYKFDRAGGVEPDWRRVHNHISGSTIAATLYSQIAGQVVGASGSTLELVLDHERSRHLHKQGLDGKAADRQVKALKDEIDALIERYEQQEVGLPDRAVYEQEAELLKSIRDRSLAQFADFEQRACGRSAGNVVGDALNVTRNVIGTVGNALNVGGLLEPNRQVNGLGSVLNLVSASIITARPSAITISSGIAGTWKEKHEKREFPELGSKTFAPPSSGRFKEMVERLERGTQKINAPIADRIAFYRAEAAQFGKDDEQEAKDKHSDRHRLVRRFRESVYGPEKMAQSIMTTSVNLRRPRGATADYRLEATANLTYTCGQVYNITELVRQRVVDEVGHRRLQAKGELPEQQAERRLAELQQLRSTLASDNQPSDK